MAWPGHHCIPVWILTDIEEESTGLESAEPNGGYVRGNFHSLRHVERNELLSSQRDLNVI